MFTGSTMSPDDQRTVFALIDKLKNAAEAERERLSGDLKTVVMMASEPEIIWNAPLILRQNNKTYRAYPID